MTKGYPSYRASGIAWMPKIPAHWETIPLKRPFRILSGATPRSSIAEYWDGDIVWITPADYKTQDKYIRKGARNITPAGYSSCSTNMILRGSIIFSKRAPIGTVAINDVELCTNQGCLSCIPLKNVSATYYYYLLSAFTDIFEAYASGSTFREISATTFGNIKLPIPPREEQEQIVRFLDWKVSAIDKLIATKEKQLSILKELLQAKIEKQLHAYPISNTLRLKQLGTFSKGGGFSRDNLVETETYPAILYGDIYTQYEYKTSVIPHHIDGIAYSASRKISKGDIVMAGTGETKDDIGKSILYMGNQSVAVGGDVIIFHPNAKNNAEYLLYQLYSQAALKHRYISSKGDIIVHIYPTAIGNILITLPCVHDQKKAVKRINANIHRVNKTLHLLNEQISNLNELKTRLISDAVTGKIDVRSIKLPNFAKEE